MATHRPGGPSRLRTEPDRAASDRARRLDAPAGDTAHPLSASVRLDPH